MKAHTTNKKRAAAAWLCGPWLLVIMAMLSSCGGGGGGTAASVRINASPISLTLGETSTLTWSSTGASSCQASGSWSGTLATNGTQTVKPATLGTHSYSISCGTSTSSVSVLVNSGTSAANTVPVVLDGGPVGVVGIINVPFVDVTLCRPGTSICQTIDHVLVDTGSYGVRILSTALDSNLALPSVTAPNGNPAGQCAQFVSGFLWGSVRQADVKMAGQLASSLPIHVAADSTNNFSVTPTDCASTGNDLGSLKALGANGILGVGLFKQDCGAACVSSAVPSTYYACAAGGCTNSTMPLAKQVANPVAAFPLDNTGIVLTMPSVSTSGASRLSGTLTFGVETQNNNLLGSAVVFPTNASGYFTTVYKGTTLSSSFIDSGSNGLFFEDASLPLCPSSVGFYCVASTYTVNAVNSGATGSPSGSVSMAIVSPSTLTVDVRAAPLAGSFPNPTGRPRTFDWGMPFFFGRSVYVVIEGTSTQRGTGPFWAY